MGKRWVNVGCRVDFGEDLGRFFVGAWLLMGRVVRVWEWVQLYGGGEWCLMGS